MNKLDLYYFLKGDVSFEDIIYKETIGSSKMLENKVHDKVASKNIDNLNTDDNKKYETVDRSDD